MSHQAPDCPAPGPAEPTHVVSLRTRGSLGSGQTSVALLPLFSRRSDKANETGVTLRTRTEQTQTTRSIQHQGIQYSPIPHTPYTHTHTHITEYYSSICHLGG